MILTGRNIFTCCFHVGRVYLVGKLRKLKGEGGLDRKSEETRGDQRLKKNYNFIAKIVAGHRITIPKEVCQVLQIKEGDLVDITVTKLEGDLKSKVERIS